MKLAYGLLLCMPWFAGAAGFVWGIVRWGKLSDAEQDGNMAAPFVAFAVFFALVGCITLPLAWLINFLAAA